MSAAQTWSADLASWAIPAQILEQAAIAPWTHQVKRFLVPDGPIPDSPSHATARAALPTGGSVLDIGCGGGRAAMALVPPASHVTGVDHQQGMLDAFTGAALRAGAGSATYLGDWPAVADDVPEADVVVCHHVLFNVPDLVPFLDALNAHALRRVIIEIPTRHPLSWLNPLWEKFWGLDRPTAPSATDALVIARVAGYDAQLIEFSEPEGRVQLNAHERAADVCMRLCLSESRIDDVAAALVEMPDQTRNLATIWWDVKR